MMFILIRVTATVQVAQAIPKHCLVLHMYVPSPGDGTVTELDWLVHVRDHFLHYLKVHTYMYVMVFFTL